MTMTDERKLRHLIARFEKTLHAYIKIISCEEIGNGQRKVIVSIKCFKYGYIFEGDCIKESWRVTE